MQTEIKDVSQVGEFPYWTVVFDTDGSKIGFDQQDPTVGVVVSTNDQGKMPRGLRDLVEHSFQKTTSQLELSPEAFTAVRSLDQRRYGLPPDKTLIVATVYQPDLDEAGVSLWVYAGNLENTLLYT